MVIRGKNIYFNHTTDYSHYIQIKNKLKPCLKKKTMDIMAKLHKKTREGSFVCNQNEN